MQNIAMVAFVVVEVPEGGISLLGDNALGPSKWYGVEGAALAPPEVGEVGRYVVICVDLNYVSEHRHWRFARVGDEVPPRG